MTSKKDKSLFGSLFNKCKNTKADQPEMSQDKELLICLQNLSSICEGNDRNVDHEIAQFKKMIKIGSTVTELQNQIITITKAVTLSATLPENNKLLKLFKQIPADIMIDEFINQSTSIKTTISLQNYRNSLSSNVLAVSSISDLIELFQSAEDSPVHTVESTASPNITHEGIQQVTSPLLRLFSQLELSAEQDEHLTQMHKRLIELKSLDDLTLFLEDASLLIISSISSSTNQFETFLIQLRQRLDIVNNCITSNEAISKVSENFSLSMAEQVSDIKLYFKDVENVHDLEILISKSLESITDHITSFNNERKSLEEESAKTIADIQHELKQSQIETDYLKDHLQQQRNKALTDPLTQLPNRHAYNERIHFEYKRWRRYKKPLSLVIGDVDSFKEINDTHGHIVGDAALKQTAQIIQKNIRGTDFVARFGGEEFVFIMPETLPIEATKGVNKIRILIQDNTIDEGNANFKLTMSFGVSNFEEDDTIIDVLKRADKALYRAKSKGRNQICVQRNNS
ncbi:MAG: GGDEF domain-containing protein [Gammaproteobacteria bacterium]|nr:GGDEF domain-containing protein [Gammaproteobacteria bacterium]